MESIKWFERVFNYETTQNILPVIIERLAGTPARLEEKLRSLPDQILTRRVDGTWTIKENVGHLTDLEPLWQGRLQDILNGETDLRPTDLQNTRTTQANHDAVPLAELLSNFRQIREVTVKLLNHLNPDDVFKSALHPRLKTPMRSQDLFLFVADHDDHHLARITELTRVFSRRG